MPCTQMRKEAKAFTVCRVVGGAAHIRSPFQLRRLSQLEDLFGKVLLAKKRTCMFQPWLGLLNLPERSECLSSDLRGWPLSVFVLMGLVLTDSEKGNFVKHLGAQKAETGGSNLRSALAI